MRLIQSGTTSTIHCPFWRAQTTYRSVYFGAAHVCGWCTVIKEHNHVYINIYYARLIETENTLIIKVFWDQFNNCPTRCDLFSLLYFCRQFYMFRVLTPIIRSPYLCNYSFWYWLTGSTTIRSRYCVGTDSYKHINQLYWYICMKQFQLNNESG